MSRGVPVSAYARGCIDQIITNDVGFNSYTKNGAQIPDFIWFNESSGENVIEK